MAEKWWEFEMELNSLSNAMRIIAIFFKKVKTEQIGSILHVV